MYQARIHDRGTPLYPNLANIIALLSWSAAPMSIYQPSGANYLKSKNKSSFLTQLVSYKSLVTSSVALN